ncbi:PREDICTED: peroxidase 44-like [Tarenaya hassleriana]|uniref:peroxidase 44-like n=1 Tax=Tarenaya hassleriana TaxID=28532 RepID=UPI00053C53B3|nr:PREDICTED: peroxidase 44-like [Tarenaya hassleriana]
MRPIPISFLVILFIFPAVLGQLEFGFYDRTCPPAESIVATVVSSFSSDRSITAALLRMHFHDCFVTGCDASLLIDSIPGRPSEKDAGPNLSVRGYEIIDEAKRQLEAKCPATVSCSDIIALATRDSVELAGGPTYLVPTGRRDGFTSNPEVVDLPGPTIPVPASVQLFADKGLNIDDMVTLIGGGHSVGVARCSLFQDRLRDPAMDPSLNFMLRNTCSGPNDPLVFLDQLTPLTVDNGLYIESLRQRAILRIDQSLALDVSTRAFVLSFASSNTLFARRFTQAMVKMGTIGVLTGNEGEIRRSCRVFNRDG